MLRIQDGRADFGSVSAEEALLGANFVPNVKVIGELRPNDG